MKTPRTLKEFQWLTSCLTSLNRFISKSIDKCLPFFKDIKKGARVKWNEQCEKAFQQLKDYLGRAPLLSKPKPRETLYLYLLVSDVATSSALMRQDDIVQLPIYYFSKALLPVETRYLSIEKLALTLVIVAIKLHPYFQAHKIRVYTICPPK